MITFEQLTKKMGTNGAKEFAVRSKGIEKTEHEKTCGIKGRIRHRMCEHGTWVIKDYEPQECPRCNAPRPTKGLDFRPYFNVGLGAFVESRGEEKRLAKKLGLQEAG